MFRSLYHHIILFRIDSSQKYDYVLFGFQEKFFFRFGGKNSKNKSYIINQSQYHDINSDKMPQMKNINDPQNKKKMV